MLHYAAGKKLNSFDGLEAGAFVVRPDVFDVLHRLLVESIYCTLAEAMQVREASSTQAASKPHASTHTHTTRVSHLSLCAAPCMQVFASEGRLSYMTVDDLDWFGEQTVASLPTPMQFGEQSGIHAGAPTHDYKQPLIC